MMVTVYYSGRRFYLLDSVLFLQERTHVRISSGYVLNVKHVVSVVNIK